MLEKRPSKRPKNVATGRQKKVLLQRVGIPKTLPLSGPAAGVQDMRGPPARQRRLRQNDLLLGTMLALPGPIWPPAAGAQPQAIMLPFFARPQREEPQPQRVRAFIGDADTEPLHREPQGAIHEEETRPGGETSERIRGRTRQEHPVRAEFIGELQSAAGKPVQQRIRGKFAFSDSGKQEIVFRTSADTQSTR